MQAILKHAPNNADRFRISKDKVLQRDIPMELTKTEIEQLQAREGVEIEIGEPEAEKAEDEA